MLTDAQLSTFKADIESNTDQTVIDALAGGSFTAIRDWYNTQASPDFTIWRTDVGLTEIAMAIDGSELESLTTAESSRLQVMYQIHSDGSLSGDATYDASRLDRRDFFDNLFSGAGGATTRAALLAIWKRLATEAEKVFATGTGSDASPAVPAIEGTVTTTNVRDALALP